MSLKNAINTISTRHSYRGEFLQESVPEEYDVVCILPVGKAKDDFHPPIKKSYPFFFTGRQISQT